MLLFNAPVMINRDYKTFKRFLKILETLAAYGFHDLSENIYSKKKFHWRENSALNNRTRPEKVRMLLEELGPTFVKFGQILSTRPDLIPQEYADELTKLTEHVAPFPIEQVRAIIRAELGKEPEALFAEFDSNVLAAASIGQVHAATLKTGEKVVVKIQRPGIHEKIDLDLDIMRYIAQKLETLDDDLARYEPTRIVDEFAYSLRRELNYQFEAANLLRFTKNMSGEKDLVIPKLYLELSSSRVLTMERIYGDSATKVLDQPDLRKKYDLPLLAQQGVNSLLSQIFEYGFFHADPHPGNIFLLDGNRICFIDFGMMGRVNENERRDFVKVIDYMLRGQIAQMSDTALRMTITGTVIGDRATFERDVADLVDENINLPLDKISVSRVLQQLLDLLQNYQLALKPNLYMMFKALMTIEHLGRTFDPSLKIVEMVRPFIQKMKLRSLNPKPYLLRFLDTFGDNLSALEALPTSLRNIFQLYESGRLTLRVEHHGLDDIEETLYITGERLSRSMLVTALIIGSALIVVAKIPPFWGEIPLIGMGGFLIAGILSIIILLDDHRKRSRFVRERRERKQKAREERRP